MKYQAKVAEPAPHFITIKPTAFVTKWTGRPMQEVACGIRTISLGTIEEARSAADAKAKALHGYDSPLFDECYNDALVREAVAAGICDPNDIDKPPMWMKAPIDEAQFFTPEAARHVYDEIARYCAKVSPTNVPLSDDEVMRLASLLAVGTLSELPSELATSHRRWLRELLDDLLMAAGA